MIARLWPIVAGIFLASCTGGGSVGAGPVGIAGVRGETLSPIRGELAGCRVASPVRVHEVLGVQLSPPAVMDRSTARSLRQWVARGVKPGFAQAGAEVTAMVVLDAYNCRTRNSVRGAPLSQHARGRAVDIGAFVLADGRRVPVLSGWRSPEWRSVLRGVHKAGCGPFGTVLGPDYDRAHANHFHVDNNRYARGRRYCR